MSNKRNDSLNEALKRREEIERRRLLTEVQDGEEKVMALDDTQRVKVLSPGRLVAKRFFRNKLAIVGLAILIFMFMFSFLFPLFYPYSQTEIFYKYDKLNIDYASVAERTESVSYSLKDDIDVHYSVKNRIDSYIAEMTETGVDSMTVTGEDGASYIIDKLGDKVYTLSANASEEVAFLSQSATVATYNGFNQSFSWTGDALDGGFESAVISAIESGSESFNYGGAQYTLTMVMKNTYNVVRATSTMEFTGDEIAGLESAAADAIAEGISTFSCGGVDYHIGAKNGGYSISAQGERDAAMVISTYVFDTYETEASLSDNFKAAALLALYDNGSFEADGAKYTIAKSGQDVLIKDASGNNYAQLNTYSVRRYSGQDSLDIGFKQATIEMVEGMIANNETSAEYTYQLPAMDAEANYVYDENGELTYEDTALSLTRTTTQFVVNCEQTTYLIDIHAGPSKEHWFGTDGDGMDILARAMYGGRISLMVGFVVVMLEMILGIILGGIAGFFGGWVDTLIMRLVDIFYCIPSMPILIITGAFFDAMKVNAYVRLVYLMAILGILGWAGVARLVRGQILSLREQEFMIAEEATGMRSSKRIFRHLVPNVMPQLIVSATMGLGSVIITESTLSFLGLGVKHPLATWGNMINSVTGSSEDMIKYTYIWIPIGLLICLTVIAFNFVGDGLRDAFDPKMKQ